MIQKEELLIRRMNYGDFDEMTKWLNDKKVLEFYGESPSSLDNVIKKYGPRIKGKHYVNPCIVEYRGKSIGYIQFYEIQKDKLVSYGYANNRYTYGMDQFIGEPGLWGKGIGTTMIQMMLNYLKQKGASRVVLEVNRRNIRAIASYKKCGFIKIKELSNELDLMEWSS